MATLQIVLSEDGSSTLYNPELDETYHSIHGAVNESTHVFIVAGLNYYFEQTRNQEIKIFEVGFGTGLNAALAFQWAEKNKVKVTFESIDTLVLDKELTQHIFAGNEKLQSYLDKCLQCKWENQSELSQYFSLNKKEVSLEEYQPSATDVVFFDAFAPSKQAEMWKLEYFQKIFNHCNSKAIFTTYCAKGQVRRDLQTAGFIVERIPGPKGKREMLRGERK